MTKLYYTSPSDEIFNEVKVSAMALWQDVDSDNDAFGYATEKINQIKDLPNVQDNFMYMVAMFDFGNQQLLARLLSLDSCLAIRERMLDGGQPEEYIAF